METQAEISGESVKQAFHAAKLIKSSGARVALGTIILAGIGFAVHPAFGMLALFICLLIMGVAMAILATRARCPKCRVKWWDDALLASTTGKKLRSVLDPNCIGHETEEFKCRNCGLELEPYLK